MQKRRDVRDVHAELEHAWVSVRVQRATGQRVVNVAAARWINRTHPELAQILAVGLQGEMFALVEAPGEWWYARVHCGRKGPVVYIRLQGFRV